MMQELMVIGTMESRLTEPACDRRQIGSMKEKLMRQIKLLRELSMAG